MLKGGRDIRGKPGTGGKSQAVLGVFQSAGTLLVRPGRFYESVSAEEDYGHAAWFLLLTAMLHGAAAGLLQPEDRLFWASIFFLNRFFLPFVMAFALYLAASVMCRGAFDYRVVFVAVAFAQVSLLASWIPGPEWKLLGGLWTIYLTGLGLTKLGRISNRRAFACLLAAFFVLLFVYTCIQYALKQ